MICHYNNSNNNFVYNENWWFLKKRKRSWKTLAPFSLLVIDSFRRDQTVFRYTHTRSLSLSLSPSLCQFHQHTCAFFIRIFRQSKNITREKLPNQCSYEKFVRIKLMKLTPSLSLSLSHTDLICVRHKIRRRLNVLVWFGLHKWFFDSYNFTY